MTVLTEAPANLPYFQWQDNDRYAENTKGLPYFQWQDNDCSDRSTSKLALFSMARK